MGCQENGKGYVMFPASWELPHPLAETIKLFPWSSNVGKRLELELEGLPASPRMATPLDGEDEKDDMRQKGQQVSSVTLPVSEQNTFIHSTSRMSLPRNPAAALSWPEVYSQVSSSPFMALAAVTLGEG